MSENENKQLARRFYEEYALSDAAKVRYVYEKYLAPDAVTHVGIPREDLNREQTIQFDTTLVPVFPDMKLTVEDMVADGDRVIIRYIMQATQEGAWMGTPATGKKLVIKNVDICKISAGKITEVWVFWGYPGMETQLGAIWGAHPKSSRKAY